MSLPGQKESLRRLAKVLDASSPASWKGVAEVLTRVKDAEGIAPAPSRDEFLRRAAAGTAFITFDYGIDGVSIEIGKYARCLEAYYETLGKSAIHMIGGDFHPQAARVLKSGWRRCELHGINGWAKWDGGKWFSALYEQDMPEGSETSRVLARTIYRQAKSIAMRLGRYLVDNQIALLIPVNIASNPGNLALTLGVVLASEAMGMRVLNSSHDYYWDGGKPPEERSPGEPPGIRDHFFRNAHNGPFFSLFKSLYPWNGKGWLQVNINRLQSRHLIEKDGIPECHVREVSTSVSDAFFEPFDWEDVVHSRVRMAHILSDGRPILRPKRARDHVAKIKRWMRKQDPCILGVRSGLTVDPTSRDLIYLLQPTRVIARKRIERNLELIEALLRGGALREEFEGNSARQLVLHITGPTPKEHQHDLERVLRAYLKATSVLPESISSRVFLAFSVGHEEHPSFIRNRYEPLTIETIYRMADAVVFPSESEGRGLPIVEASASGIPIICSQYQPRAVFRGVVGERLSEERRIRYTLFPEGDFGKEFLAQVAELLLHPESKRDDMAHNRRAVRARYSSAALRKRFVNLLDDLHSL